VNMANLKTNPATEQDDLISYAADLLAKGFWLFPLSFGEKKAAHKGWQEEATQDPALVRRWVSQGYDLGIFTGKLGARRPDGGYDAILAIDIDVKDSRNGNAAIVDLELDGLDFPDTLEHHSPTSEGRHVIYRVREPVRQDLRGKVIGHGVDIKSSGNLIACVRGGKIYKSNGVPIADAPQWLVERCEKPTQAERIVIDPAMLEKLSAPDIQERATRRAEEYLEADPIVIEGGRNAKTYERACHLKNLGILDYEAAARLIDEHGQCAPPLDYDEIVAATRSAYKSDTVPLGNLATVTNFGVVEPPAETTVAVPHRMPFSEDALALDFAETFESELRYVATWGRWMRFDGKRWAEDNTLSAFDDVRKLLREHIATVDPSHRDVRPLMQGKSVAAIERLARCDRRLAATADQWDADPWTLCTPAGMVDLRAGALREQRAGDYATKMTAVGPGGNCPLWRAFLDKVTANRKDLQIFLQKMAGYALTGSTREQALFFLYGTGGNGKGVFLNTIAAILGEYARTAPIETFTQSSLERHRDVGDAADR
jgi:hypothetical protein